jgi:O-antigen/teichoic acid export membrane protein
VPIAHPHAFDDAVIFFLAMNFDRLYFAKQITLTMLGIYSIARSMADMLSNFVTRTSNMVLFPAVAAMQASAPEVRGRLLRSRRTMLLLVATWLNVALWFAFETFRFEAVPAWVRRLAISCAFGFGCWAAILGIFDTPSSAMSGWKTTAVATRFPITP